VPGRGIPLGLTSTYNSQDPRRWTNNYLMRVQAVGSARVVHQENASTVYFFDDGRGGWHVEGGAQATLTTNAGGGYTFRRTHELTSFAFDAGGRLLSQADRNGYQTTLSYDSGGRLSRVTDPAGRSLTFSYDASGRLSSVSDPLGRRVSFTYDSNVPLLGSLTDAAGGVTRFAYSPDGMWHLTSVESPNHSSGYSMTNAYDGGVLAYQNDRSTGRRCTMRV